MTDQAASSQKFLGLGAAEVARRLGALGVVITSQAISQWKRVPAERVLDIERATGISRHDLRPDLYPVESAPRETTEAAA